MCGGLSSIDERTQRAIARIQRHFYFTGKSIGSQGGGEGGSKRAGIASSAVGRRVGIVGLQCSSGNVFFGLL